MRVKEAIIVEGKYDKIRLQSFLDAQIIATTGFDIFKNTETKEYIKKLAMTKGVVILTDSDYAGFKIRNYIKSFVDEKFILNAYIPEIKGKEKRKSKPSSDGLLGVEGIDNAQILKALKDAGCTIDDKKEKSESSITKIMLYNDGFIGGENSSDKRKDLCEYFGIPTKISTNALIKALNSVATLEKYMKFKEIEEIKRKQEQSEDNV